MIRDHLMSDLDDHHELISDPVVMYYLDSIRTDTKEESLKNIKLAMEDIDKPGRKYYFFRISERTNGKHIGEIGYTVDKVTPKGKYVEIGYFIREKYWRQGYAGEALRAVIDYAFKEGGVYRILGTCMKDNEGSARTLAGCGFTLEGDLKKFEFYKNAYRDRLIFRLLKDEWEGKHRGSR